MEQKPLNQERETMDKLLFFLASIAAALGALITARSVSAVHEIAGLLLFIICSILFSAGAIIQVLPSTSKASFWTD
jgi:hypothetical protein